MRPTCRLSPARHPTTPSRLVAASLVAVNFRNRSCVEFFDGTVMARLQEDPERPGRSEAEQAERASEEIVRWRHGLFRLWQAETAATEPATGLATTEARREMHCHCVFGGVLHTSVTAPMRVAACGVALARTRVAVVLRVCNCRVRLFTDVGVRKPPLAASCWTRSRVT